MAVVETMVIEVTCPVCGHVNKLKIDSCYGNGLVCCDVEDGGCDNHFAYKWSVRVDAKVFASTILWYESQPAESNTADGQALRTTGTLQNGNGPAS